MKSRPYADALNTFFRIPTPISVTMRAGLDTVWRFRTRPICAKCGKSWPKPYTMTIPKFKVVAKITHPVALPNIHDSKIMEQIMVSVCEAGVGCWENCKCGKNFNQECLNQCVLRGVPGARAGDCPCICSCAVGCGNQKKYPCRCGHVDIFHMKGCPVGAFKRDSSFKLALARQRIVTAGRIRERDLLS